MFKVPKYDDERRTIVVVVALSIVAINEENYSEIDTKTQHTRTDAAEQLNRRYYSLQYV